MWRAVPVYVRHYREGEPMEDEPIRSPDKVVYVARNCGAALMVVVWEPARIAAIGHNEFAIW
jgi:hypothetical protein